MRVRPSMPARIRAAAALVAGAITAGAAPAAGQSWDGFGHDPTHDAHSRNATQVPQLVRWQTPVDLRPQLSGSDLLIHYGSPLVTGANTVIVPVKTGAEDGFRVEGRRGADGSLLWQLNSDYTLPPHNWTPSFGIANSDAGVVMPAAGGTILVRSRPDSAAGTTSRLAFFGASTYNANPAAFGASVMICTPITVSGRSFVFGFVADGRRTVVRNGVATPLTSGLAIVSTAGKGTWISAAEATGDSRSQKVACNCAPALSRDGKTLYVAINEGPGYSGGYLVALNATTLAPLAKVRLKDVKNPGNDAVIPDDGSASPTVGSDGDVYYGVLENPFGSNHLRGWLLHFDSGLATAKVPGAFGWDDTPSVIPARSVRGYRLQPGEEAPPYFLLTKYNNYAEGGGDGVNKMAVLDPSHAMADPITGASVMREAFTIAGPTPDPEFVATHPGAVREWCVNSAVVDPVRNCALINSEDGSLYRWNLMTRALDAALPLTGGIGEAYTPVISGADGAVYAINHATLFSCVARPTGSTSASRPGINLRSRP